MIATPVNRQFVHPPCHGLKPESVTSANLWEKTKPVRPQTQVANRSGSVAQTLSRGCGHRRGSEASPSGGPGAQPRHAFGSFRRETKGTRGAGRSARIGGGRDHRPCINLPRGAEHGKAMLSRSARIRGRRGPAPRMGSAEGRQPLALNWVRAQPAS